MSRNISFKFAAILLVGITILIGCTPNSDDYRKHDDPVPVVPDVPEDPVSYAERILGTTIDPNQDWVLTSACSVTVTADANLDNISTVAVLEGNPYAGDSYVMVSKAATHDERFPSLSWHLRARSTSMPPASAAMESTWHAPSSPARKRW